MRYSERFDHEVGQVAQFFVIEVLMFDSLVPHSRILPRYPLQLGDHSC